MSVSAASGRNPAPALSFSENAGPLQQFWPWPCTLHYVWLCLITLSPGSATSWASLFSLQPKQLSEVFLFLLPIAHVSKKQDLSILYFLYGGFCSVFRKQITLTPGASKWKRHWSQAVSNCYIGRVALCVNSNGWGFNIHDAAKR